MSYSHTEKWPNGDFLESVEFRKCDICGLPIPPQSNYWFSKNDTDICLECCESIAASCVKFCGEMRMGLLPYRLHVELEKCRRKRPAIPKELRNQILKKYKHCCLTCGETDARKLSIDHIIPYSRGGSDEVKNLRVLCRSCNSKKGAKL
jgi:hypothetical protein